jgi:hypothetical protein
MPRRISESPLPDRRDQFSELGDRRVIRGLGLRALSEAIHHGVEAGGDVMEAGLRGGPHDATPACSRATAGAASDSSHARIQAPR